ncbi:hypothetical protein OAQ07_05480 [Flavobacteriaceae bacterium]|nr:hypothetical protein [Flavobacteriaceae bacterium]
MKFLFNHKWKIISGWIFYLTIPVGIYLLFTDSFEDLLKIRVFSLFHSETIFTTSNTENIIGSRGFQWIENGIIDEILTFVIIVSGIIHSFCKEKIEDELISKIRMDSLVLSLYINYGVLLFFNFFVYELSYFYVMVFHLFTILILFNLIFRYKLNIHYKS